MSVATVVATLACVALTASGAADVNEVWMLADVHLDRTYKRSSDPTTNCQSGKGGKWEKPSMCSS